MNIVPIHRAKGVHGALYKSLFEESLEAFYITSVEGIIIDVNLACQRMFGFEKSEFLGMKVQDFYVDAEERIHFRKEIDIAGTVDNFKIKLKRKDGSIIQCRLSSSIHYDHEGNISGYHGIIRDAMDMRSVVDALLESEIKYRALFEDSKDAIYHSTIEGDLVDVNKTASAILGYEMEVLLEMNLADLFKYPEEADRFFEELVKMELVKDFAAKLVRKNGTEVDALITTTVKHSEHKQILGCQGVIRDITSQIRAQEREHMLIRAMESTTEGIIMINNLPGNQIFYSNPAASEICELDLLDIIGSQIDLLFGKRTDPEQLKMIHEAIKAGTYYSGEIISYKSTGEIFWNNFTINPVFNDAEEAVSFICRIQDVTQRKLQQDKLFKLQETRMQLEIDNQKMRAAAVIEGQEEERQRVARELHDGLGQMLTAVNLNVQSLDTGMTPENSETLGNVKKLLTETIIETKRISQDLMPNVLKDFGLVAAIDKICEQQNTPNAPKIIFQHFGKIKRYDSGIERGLFRFCQEALNNAMKYSEASEINVQLLHQGKSIILMIEDDGVGFNYEEILLAAKDKIGGNGLTNMYERINLLGGQFNIDSSPGHGTVIEAKVSTK